MSVYHQSENVTLLHGDCIDVMRTLPDNSVDSIVTDPPYGLGFMGKEWDALPPGLEWAEECLRVLKPGGHLLAFGGTRTWHRLAVAVEDAGFDIRDSVAWLYGSGFPKSQDVSKAIDKANGRKFEDRFALGRHIRERREAAGLTRADVNALLGATTKCEHYESTSPDFARVPTVADFRVMRDRLGLSNEHLPLVERVEAEREIIGTRKDVATRIYDMGQGPKLPDEINVTAPATDAARQWEGWGTALKPAFEPVIMARKPFKGTVAANVLEHGTGALNIDGCRIGTEGGSTQPSGVAAMNKWRHQLGSRPAAYTPLNPPQAPRPAGRFPANVILDEDQAAALDEQSGVTKSSAHKRHNTEAAHNKTSSMGKSSGDWETKGIQDSGGASRFFYVAKAPKKERPVVDGLAHSTVKPLTLMRYLAKLVTPPGGTVLEPFAGSGTTAEACVLEGFNCIAIEREAEYLPLIEVRIDRALAQIGAAA